MVTAIQPRTRVRAPQVEPHVAWYTPQPLWSVFQRAGTLRQRRGEPVILRFDVDDFMERLIALLASSAPEGLAGYVAQRETWRAPDVGLAGGQDKPGTLKLFQPSHNRYYLVAGALACRIPGAPDKTINTSAGESAFFVLRRRVNGVEHGWSTGRQGTAGQPPRKGWAQVSQPDKALLPDEERYPLFLLTFRQDGMTRRMLAGMVPVASRETFAGGGTLSLTPTEDPRPAIFEDRVTARLNSVRVWYDAHPNPAASNVSAADRQQTEYALASTLLELMQLIKEEVAGDLYTRIVNGTACAGVGSDTSTLVGLICNTKFTDPGIPFDPNNPDKNKVALVRLLAELEKKRAQFEALVPGALLSHLLGANLWIFDRAKPDLGAWLPPQPTDPLKNAPIQTRFVSALKPLARPAESYYPPAPTPKLDPTGGATYVIRLVYERPQCKAPDISGPTRPFTLAPFFDPDAPARRIRIPMPVDVSPGELGRFDKGVSVLLSKELRQQMARVKGLAELMDGDVGSPPSLDIGMICSLSIPIITICALILLMLVVQLLNIIFWWLPSFILCLPLKLSKG